MAGFTSGGSDFTELQDSIRDWLVREDDEVTDRIPSFIRLAEIRAGRDVRTTRLQAVLLYTATQDDQDNGYMPVPDDYNGMVAVSAATGRGSYALESVTPQQWLAAGGNAGSGPPWIYTVIGSRIYTTPPQGIDAVLTLIYYALPPRLGALHQTNVLSQYYGDLLLYGALAEAMPYLKDDARLPNFGNLYSAALSTIYDEDERMRLDEGAQIVTSPYTATVASGSI